MFRLSAKGVELIEVAPGVDIQRDILAHMEFVPIMDTDRIQVRSFFNISY